MDIEKRFLIIIVIGIVLYLNSLALAAEGPATFYNPSYIPSACYGNKDQGSMIAGVRDELWKGGAACGTFYKVTCKRAANQAKNPCKTGSVTVKVVDRCYPAPACNGIINLSRDAFSKIANLDAGKVIVEYQETRP